jgi:chromosome segregation ATPase
VTAAAVEDAQQRATAAAAAADAARLELARCRTALSEARDALAQAERALDRHVSARATAASDTQRTGEERRRLDDELGAARQARVEAGERLTAAQAERDRLAQSVPRI